MVRLQRYQKNPILKPRKDCPWEKYVFNSAAIDLNGKIYLLYRALSDDKISRIGQAVSQDGFRISKRLKTPIFVPKLKEEKAKVEGRNSGVEDPRITRIGNKLYMTYTAVNGQLTQVAIASIRTKDFLSQSWKWKRHGIIFPGRKDKDAVLLPEKKDGKFVLYHRLKPNIYISYSKDLKKWTRPKVLMKPRLGKWDSLKIGAAAPPIDIGNYWLFIYHGVEDRKDKGLVYRLGYAIIDKRKPEKIVYRSKEPILSPERKYEKEGQVPNVVFSCGAILRGDKIFVYYGGADSVLGVATARLSSFLKFEK